MSEITFVCDACDGNGDYFGPLGPDRCAKCGGNAHVARALRSALAEAESERDRLREALRASAPDAVREAAEHYVGTCAETNGGKMCPRCLAVVLGIAARDGGGE